MVRVRDALDGCRGVVRVFDSATSVVSTVVLTQSTARTFKFSD